MFKYNNKTVQVKLLNPITVSSPTSTHPQIAPAEYNQLPIDVGLAVKLATLIFIVTQASLLVYGYSVLVGYYDYYGIDINELDIGKPTLLLYGYMYALSTIFELSKGLPRAGAVTLVMLCLIVSVFFMIAVTDKAKVGTRVGVLFSIFIPLIFIVITPAKGITLGLDIGKTELQKFTGGHHGGKFEIEQIIISSDKQKLVGKLILSDSRFTFLLTQSMKNGCAPVLTIYKLNNLNNKIMRQTVLTPFKDLIGPLPEGC